MTRAFDTILLTRAATLRDAITAIDGDGRQIALVVDGDGRLEAIVSDGDIRRGLLRGLTLDAPVTEVMVTAPAVVRADAPPGTARREMRARGLNHMPVLDADGRVVRLVWINDATMPDRRETRIVLMAGGLGMRLRPLTRDTPKPMLQIGGRPLLENIILNFRAQGFYRFTIALNYKAHVIRDHFGDGSALGVEIDYIEETGRQGTAGALALFEQPPRNPFIVMNGDLLTSVQFGAMLDAHVETGAQATVSSREFSMQVPYGVLRSTGARLTAIEEKPTETYAVSAGIYVFSPEVLDHLEPGVPTDTPDLIGRLIAAGAPVTVFPIREYWVDIGRLEDLDRARGEFSAVFGT